MPATSATRFVPVNDRQVRLPTCDVCGPAEEVHCLEGPAGDVVVCDSCLDLLTAMAGTTKAPVRPGPPSPTHSPGTTPDPCSHLPMKKEEHHEEYH